MALQGDLSSFTLPDVLRLLSSTHKTGALEVRNPPATGRLQFHRGQITEGDVSTSEQASRPADVVFEMFRFGGGTFVFDDVEDEGASDGDDSPSGVAVMEVLGEAEALVDQWAEVEAVVPSMVAVITMAPELTGEEVTLRADQWRAMASLGAASTVQAIATHCGLGDLDASRLVKDLVEADLVSIAVADGVVGDGDHTGALSTDTAVEVEPDTEAEAEAELEVEEASMDVMDDDVADATAPIDDTATPAEDLFVLHGEEGPVVLGEGDGRLLPEPLLDEVGEYQPGTFEPETYEHAVMDSSAPAITMGVVDGNSFESFEEAEDSTGPAPDAELASMARPPADEDRGSLLRFLSTVEP